MSLGTNIAAGLIIGKVTGNYQAALISVLIIDIDHLIPYIKHRIIFDLKKLWKAITDTEDPYGNQNQKLS